MKFELVDEEWRGGGTPRAVELVEVRDELEAVAALRARKRINTISLLERVKRRALRALLAEVRELGADPLAQAFFLGISETCLRKWVRTVNTASWPPSKQHLDTAPNSR